MSRKLFCNNFDYLLMSEVKANVNVPWTVNKWFLLLYHFKCNHLWVLIGYYFLIGQIM